ncbi:MAG: transpeptidase family protein [Bacteroidaceae bacterium]|nr:transpeptidase family protein [Bacteroidaceae bacterium]
MKSNKTSKNIVKPYGCVVGILLMAALAIVVKMVIVAVIQAPHWNEKADKMWLLDVIEEAVPHRGDILAHDGTPLAQTVALYTVYVDFKDPRIDSLIYRDIIHPKGVNLPDTLKLDSLCGYLAEKFPVKTKAEYYDYISKRRDAKSSSCVLAEDVTDMQYKELTQFSVFKNRRKGKYTGLTRIRSYKRFYPYDSLTSVVLGRAALATKEMLDKHPEYKRNEWHGSSGLECDLDTLLFGKYGTQQRRQAHWGYSVEEVEPPVRGYDVVTTLDMTMQEIAERNLMDMVRVQGAEYGTAIIMEVSTGEIRAMANVERNKEGRYTFNTRRNYAVTAIEPGSVVKTLSMVMAMENGRVNPLREFDSSGAIPEIGGYKKISFYKNPLTVQEVLIKSDNRGICKIVGDVYRGRYNDFVEDIRNSGIMSTADLPLPDAQRPHVSPMHFEKQWQYYAFAQMIFGYHNRFAPVTTLSVYNAVANNGRLMKPQLLKGLMRDGEIDTIYAPVCLNEHFCTPEHAEQVREMLHGVVYSPAGTATVLQKGRVDIAGKTGTANAVWESTKVLPKGSVHRGRVLEKDSTIHGTIYADGLWRLAFAGFFPYDQPQYSCIVVIDKPRRNKAWAGGVAGGVFRAIAEEMYSRNLLECDVEYKATEEVKNPPRNQVYTPTDDAVYGYLGQYPQPDTVNVHKPLSVEAVALYEEQVVPSVVGYSAADAIYLLEKLGFVVEVQGAGRVAQQSIEAGIPLQKGMNMKLTLK